MIKSIVTMFVVISLTAIGLHTVFSWVPRSLADVDGRDKTEEEGVVDLKERLRQSLDKSFEVTITERELNLYIAEHLQLTHSSIVDDYIAIQGVYVDLKPNLMDITIDREINYEANLQEDGSKRFSFLPLNQTISLQLAVESKTADNGDVHTQVSFPSAKYGMAPAPGGLVAVVKPTFDVIAKFFEEELSLAYNNKTSVVVEDGLIRIDPRPIDAR